MPRIPTRVLAQRGLSVSVLVTTVSSSQMAELIEMPYVVFDSRATKRPHFRRGSRFPWKGEILGTTSRYINHMLPTGIPTGWPWRSWVSR